LLTATLIDGVEIGPSHKKL